jgi:hypothetical protein
MRALKAFLLSVLVIGLSYGVVRAAEPTLALNSPRPLAAAASALEKIYLVPITYEDTRYVHESEITTDDQGRLMAKSWPVSFDYEVPAADATLETRKALAATALHELLKNYETLRGKSMFTVVPTTEGFDIIAVNYTSASGATENLQPLLDTPVSITANQQSMPDVLNDLVTQISQKTGRIVVLASPLSQRYKATINVSNQPARLVLSELLKQMPMGYEAKPDVNRGTHLIPTSMSWRLTCSTHTNPECGLNFHVVTPTGGGGAGSMLTTPHPKVETMYLYEPREGPHDQPDPLPKM